MKVYDFGREFFQVDVSFGKKESHHSISDSTAPSLPIRNIRVDDHSNLQESDALLPCKFSSQATLFHPNGLGSDVHDFNNSHRESSPTYEPFKLPLSASFADLKSNQCKTHHISIGQQGKDEPTVAFIPAHQTSERLSRWDTLTAKAAEVSRTDDVVVKYHPQKILDESLSAGLAAGCTESNIVDHYHIHNALFSGIHVDGVFPRRPDYDLSRGIAQSHEAHVAHHRKKSVNGVGHRVTMEVGRNKRVPECNTLQEEYEKDNRIVKLVAEHSALQGKIRQQDEENDYEKDLKIAMEQSSRLEALREVGVAAAEEALVQKIICQSKLELEKADVEEEKIFKTALENSIRDQKHVSHGDKETLEEIGLTSLEGGTIREEVSLRDAIDISLQDLIVQPSKECCIDDDELNVALSLSQKEKEEEEFLVTEVLRLSLQDPESRNADDASMAPYLQQESCVVDGDISTEDPEEENVIDNFKNCDE